MVSLRQSGESIAAAYLESLGWTIMAQNWRCPLGEIDLIAHDPLEDATVVVEVKTRSGLGFGSPVEAVDSRKITKLRQLMGQLLATESPRCSDIRIDVIGILRRRGYAPEIDHRRGIS